MLRIRSGDRFGAEIGALEECLERARGALACPYSSSAEFEAAVIRAQRARGAFVPRSVTYLRWLLAVTAAGAMLALLSVIL